MITLIIDENFTKDNILHLINEIKDLSYKPVISFVDFETRIKIHEIYTYFLYKLRNYHEIFSIDDVYDKLISERIDNSSKVSSEIYSDVYNKTSYIKSYQTFNFIKE